MYVCVYVCVCVCVCVYVRWGSESSKKAPLGKSGAGRCPEAIADRGAVGSGDKACSVAIGSTLAAGIESRPSMRVSILDMEEKRRQEIREYGNRDGRGRYTIVGIVTVVRLPGRNDCKSPKADSAHHGIGVAAPALQ